MRLISRCSQRVATLFLIMCSVLGMGVANVQAAETEESEQSAGPGFYTDDFQILPEIQLTTLYNDNVYATSTDELSDTILILTPLLKINSRWEKHRLRFEAGANLGRYQEYTTEDYDDYWIDASGNYELSPATSLFGSAGYARKHESRDSKDSNQSGEEPTPYSVTSLQLGGRHTLGDTVLRAVASYEKLDFDNVPGLYNDDRDRTQNGLGLRVTRELDRQTRVYVQGLLNQRDYVMTMGGVNRDSSGYDAVVGLIRNFGKKDRFEAYAGVLSQDYEDSAFKRFTTADFGLKLRWYPAETYKVTGNLNRSLRETTEQGSSGYLLTKLDLQLEKTFSADFLGYISYTYGFYDYQGIGRKDDYNGLTLGLNYSLNRHVLISGSYSYIDNDSNDEILNPVPGDSYDFSQNLFLLSVKARF
jgi:hypothetical protein